MKYNSSMPNPHRQNYKSNKKGKFTILTFLLGICVIVLVGYAYYTLSKLGNNNGDKKEKSICTVVDNTGQSGNCDTSDSVVNDSASDSAVENIEMSYIEDSDTGLTPSVVNLQLGKKYTITINPKITIYGCMNAISLPGLDDNLQNIRAGEPIVFNVDATTSGEYEFLCGMGVSHGVKVLVK